MAIWIAATRAIVGAHYPSDIVAGLAFGFAATVLTAIVFARLGYIFQAEADGPARGQADVPHLLVRPATLPQPLRPRVGQFAGQAPVEIVGAFLDQQCARRW